MFLKCKGSFALCVVLLVALSTNLSSLSSDSDITLDDVVGLDDAKQILTEVILLQNQRPDVSQSSPFIGRPKHFTQPPQNKKKDIQRNSRRTQRHSSLRSARQWQDVFG